MSKNSTVVMATKESNKPLMLAVSIMIFIALFVANFAKGQPAQGVPNAKDPCPPAVSQTQKLSRPIGTNGAYVECNPNISINPGNNCGLSLCGQQYFVPAGSTYSGWAMFTCGAIFFILALFIGLLTGYFLRHHTQNGNVGGNGNGGSGGAGGTNTNHFESKIIVYPPHSEQLIINTSINVATLKKNFATWILAKDALKKVGVKNIEQYAQYYQEDK